MALLKSKLTADEHGKLAEPLKEFYVAEGDGFMLETDLNEDVGKLKSSLEGARKDATEEKKKLEKLALQYKGVDPVKYGEFLKDIQEATAREQEIRAQLENVKNQLNEAHGKETSALMKKLTDSETENSKTTRLFHNEMVESRAVAAIAASKGSAALLLPHVKSRCKVLKDANDRFTVQIFTEKGEPALDSKGNPLTMAGLVEEMKQSDVFGRAFEGSGQSGTGGFGTRKVPGNPGQVMISREDAKSAPKYQAARKAAMEKGVELVVEPEGA